MTARALKSMMPKMFSMSCIKEHYSLVPIIGCCAAAGAFCGGYVTYMLTRKTDFSFSLSNWREGTPPYTQLQPTDVRKFVSMTNKFEVDPEIHKLRQEIGSYKN